MSLDPRSFHTARVNNGLFDIGTRASAMPPKTDIQIVLLTPILRLLVARVWPVPPMSVPRRYRFVANLLARLERTLLLSFPQFVKATPDVSQVNVDRRRLEIHCAHPIRNDPSHGQIAHPLVIRRNDIPRRLLR